MLNIRLVDSAFVIGTTVSGVFFAMGSLSEDLIEVRDMLGGKTKALRRIVNPLTLLAILSIIVLPFVLRSIPSYKLNQIGDSFTLVSLGFVMLAIGNKEGGRLQKRTNEVTQILKKFEGLEDNYDKLIDENEELQRKLSALIGDESLKK